MGSVQDHAMQEALTSLPDKVDFITRIDRASLFLNRGLAWLACGSLLLMVFMVVGNALLRMMDEPFTGAAEVAGWLSAVTIAFGLGYTQVNRGYVEIDALVDRLPQSFQKPLRLAILFISMIFFALVSWQIAVYGFNVMRNGNLSETLWIPFYPLIILLAVGFAGLTLAILADFIKELNGGAGR